MCKVPFLRRTRQHRIADDPVQSEFALTTPTTRAFLWLRASASSILSTPRCSVCPRKGDHGPDLPLFDMPLFRQGVRAIPVSCVVNRLSHDIPRHTTAIACVSSWYLAQQKPQRSLVCLTGISLNRSNTAPQNRHGEG
jgi:hypothetical protein